MISGGFAARRFVVLSMFFMVFAPKVLCGPARCGAGHVDAGGTSAPANG
jgi:hypothetical protein